MQENKTGHIINFTSVDLDRIFPDSNEGLTET